jgi:hypothetical protein
MRRDEMRGVREAAGEVVVITNGKVRKVRPRSYWGAGAGRHAVSESS